MTTETPPADSLPAPDPAIPEKLKNDEKSKGLSLRMNFSWTFVGYVFYAAAQGFLLILLSKVAGPEPVGLFSLGLGITAPFILLTNLQLRSVQATDAQRKYSPGHYLALRLIMTLLGLAIIVVVVFASGYTPEKAAVILVIGLAKGVEAISDVLFGLLQQRERLDYIAKSTMIKGTLSLLLMTTTVAVTHSIVWGSVALLISWTLVLVFYDIPAVRWMASMTVNAPDGITPKEALTPRWEWNRLASLTWLALPLGFVMMMISLNNNIPTYFVEHYGSGEDLGIFSVMQYLMLAGTTVVNALGQSAIPRLARYYTEARVGPFVSLALRLMGVSLVMAVAGVLVAIIGGPQLLSLVFKAEFAREADIFVLVMVAAGVSYVASFAGYTMTAARYFRVQTILFAITVVVTFVACALLIPQDAVRGAVWVMMIANLVQLVGSLLITAYAVWRIRGARPSTEVKAYA